MPRPSQDEIDALYEAIPEPNEDGQPPHEFSKFPGGRAKYYDADTRMSSSALRCYADDPTEFYHYYVLRDREDAGSKATLFGNYVHTMMLRPQALGDEYLHAKDTKEGKKPDERSNDGKALVAKIKQAAAGRKIVYDNDHRTAEQMIASVMNHPLAFKLLGYPAMCEVPFQWWEPVRLRDGRTRQVNFKMMLDRLCFVRPRKVIIFDVKTSADPAPYPFWYSVRDFKYDWQAAIYERGCNRMGLDVLAFYFCVVGSAWPHHTAIYRLNDARRGMAQVAYQAKLAQLSDLQQFAEDRAIPVDRQAGFYRPYWTNGPQLLIDDFPRK